uniref:Glutamyl-tRNA(Gln) amidotransferase subunit A n=1 Tax=Pyricularia oryzae (strain P131) TaxID=1143193 RepID=L7JEN9_PYRO1
MQLEPYRLTASETLEKVRAGELTVERYAQSLLDRIKDRDDAVQAWAYLEPEQVLSQARDLDRIPPESRGPLHGVAIGVKDIFYTKDMPTQHNSPIYANDAPAVDSGPVAILRQAGALIVGKTTTTEFAATVAGTKTRNPHDPARTPGGSSSGSGAAVGDMQAALALGTQTGGSTIRPGSFNGIYAYKPTWNAVSREGQKIYSLILDTLGAGPGTQAAMQKAADLLRAHGAAAVDEISLPADLDALPEWHRVVITSDGRSAFRPEYAGARDQLSPYLVDQVENAAAITRRQQLAAFDAIAAARPRVDEILAGYDAVVVPSVPDEAPTGLESTGSAAFCVIWTALHTPVVNIPGFMGENGMPIGLSLVAPRYQDRRLLSVCEAVGRIFEAEGGWKSGL